MRTYSTRAKDVERQWWVIDAADRTLGKVATEVANLLMGKHKPLYAPYIDTGDYVVVVNAAKVTVSGKKAEQKTYYRYSGYPGGLKSASFKEVFDKDPSRVIELAVKGMLPHNRLGRAMFKKLKVYPEDEHPHQAQTPLRRPERGEGRRVTRNEESEISSKER
ncbi:MAG: 50S ribosomal protein L13 [Chloroflexi bacterium RBG_13_51_36]|nr:MAG: 50S ribosomal protein L13 [Chloroflexi bacterium RBG_13_51_36]